MVLNAVYNRALSAQRKPRWYSGVVVHVRSWRPETRTFGIDVTSVFTGLRITVNTSVARTTPARTTREVSHDLPVAQSGWDLTTHDGVGKTIENVTELTGSTPGEHTSVSSLRNSSEATVWVSTETTTSSLSVTPAAWVSTEATFAVVDPVRRVTHARGVVRSTISRQTKTRVTGAAVRSDFRLPWNVSSTPRCRSHRWEQGSRCRLLQPGLQPSDC